MSDSHNSAFGPRKILVFAANFLKMAVTLVVTLGAMEFAVRWVADDGKQFDLEMWKYATQLKRASADPLIGHEHVPNSSAFLMGVTIEINEFGHRDDLTTLAKPEGVRRILMLGDSFAVGWGLPQENTTSEILQALLNQSDDGWRYEVVNMGIGNSNTDMQVRALEAKGQQFSPDLVVLNYFIDDAEPTPVPKGGLIRERSYGYIYLWGRFNVIRYRFGLAPNLQSYYTDLYRPGEKGWQRTREAIARLAAFSRSEEIGLIIANYPDLRQIDPYPFASVSTELAAVADSESVDFVDLLPYLASENPASLWVHPQDAHPNAKTNAVFAAAIFPFIRASFGAD